MTEMDFTRCVSARQPFPTQVFAILGIRGPSELHAFFLGVNQTFGIDGDLLQGVKSGSGPTLRASILTPQSSICHAGFYYCYYSLLSTFQCPRLQAGVLLVSSVCLTHSKLSNVC